MHSPLFVVNPMGFLDSFSTSYRQPRRLIDSKPTGFPQPKKPEPTKKKKIVLSNLQKRGYTYVDFNHYAKVLPIRLHPHPSA